MLRLRVLTGLDLNLIQNHCPICCHGCLLVEERYQVGLQVILVDDEQLAARAELARLVQDEHAPIVNVDHQGELLLPRLGLALGAAGEPRVLLPPSGSGW